MARPTSGYKKKTEDIERSLVHRARLRKKYFKLLDSEGLSVPEKKSTHRKAKDLHEKEDPDSEKEDNEDEQTATESTTTTESNGAEHPKMTYGDRVSIIQRRREDKKKAREEEKQRHIAEREKRKTLHLKHKKQMTQYTQKGQPRMGPRIDRLLDKIRMSQPSG